MKHRTILALLTLITGPLLAQNITHTVTVTENGTLIAPADFWIANAPGIDHALGNITSTVAGAARRAAHETITGNWTFIEGVRISDPGFVLAQGYPITWGDDLRNVELLDNGVGMLFAQSWGNPGSLLIFGGNTLFLCNDSAVLVLDNVSRGSYDAGFGFNGAPGLLYGAVGDPYVAHWSKQASIALDDRILWINNVTPSLNWATRTLEGNWTANGTTFAIAGNVTARGAPLMRWRGTAASDPADPEPGDTYWNTGNSSLMLHNGTGWIKLN